MQNIVVAIPRKFGIWLSLGGFHERGHDWGSDRRIYNSHIIIDKQGAVCHSQTLPWWLLLSQYYWHSNFIHRRNCFSLQEVPFVWCGAARKRCFFKRKCLHNPWTIPRALSPNSHWQGVILSCHTKCIVHLFSEKLCLKCFTIPPRVIWDIPKQSKSDHGWQTSYHEC